MALWGPHAVAQCMTLPLKMHYLSCPTVKDKWHEQKSQRYIENAGGRASSMGVSHSSSTLRWSRKSFFKHLTGAECTVPCLRVIATRPHPPTPRTGVITLHFTLLVILSCCVSVFEQHVGSCADWLNTIFYILHHRGDMESRAWPIYQTTDTIGRY